MTDDTKRLSGDYGAETLLTVRDVTALIQQARELLQEAQRLLPPRS